MRPSDAEILALPPVDVEGILRVGRPTSAQETDPGPPMFGSLFRVRPPASIRIRNTGPLPFGVMVFSARPTTLGHMFFAIDPGASSGPPLVGPVDHDYLRAGRYEFVLLGTEAETLSLGRRSMFGSEHGATIEVIPTRVAA